MGEPQVLLERHADDVWILNMRGNPNGKGSFQNTFNPGKQHSSLYNGLYADLTHLYISAKGSSKRFLLLSIR